MVYVTMSTFFPTWKSNYFKTIVEKTSLLSCTGNFVRNKIYINHIVISEFYSTFVIFMSILMLKQYFPE